MRAGAADAPDGAPPRANNQARAKQSDTAPTGAFLLDPRMAEKIKIRTAPPLPFQGAKRCFARDFANVLNLFINRMGGG